MRKLALTALFVAAIAMGDTLLKNDNANIGPVTSLNCLKDGGIGCAKDAGSVGTLYCQTASALTVGCVTPGAQSFAGVKTFTSAPRVANFTHAALPVGCSAGQLAYCTTHDSVAQCKGIGGGVFDWVDEFGSSGGGVTIANLSGNRLFYVLSGYLGTFKLSYGYTITGVTALVRAGTGTSATINLRLSDGTNNCDCPVHCDTGTIDACTGNCTYAANTAVIANAAVDSCTTPPTFLSDITVTGYK